jgi:hypothetical protein
VVSALGLWLSAVDTAGFSPRIARFASFIEKLLRGQLGHIVSLATWHPDAPAEDLTAITQALPSNSAPKGSPSIDCDFLISHRTSNRGLVHVTQTDPANTIDDAADRQTCRQGER